ncbi:hypothetical protein ANOM_006651 [Aspergillus nomiae NRRL 13137]|uniref:Peptidase S1 domain-containing protein n=1 Tax=Aspergillus nomiae NRRL (strain ATCC 15546 / NRRL 13137 / CBS 260.88 / M93) TaxID=1509407 RepID=A0A0L1J2D2_ASPN3|nr:uncharacterized protein ANOM_006651 [Aspergillus nomiae NRRL 13137]KNG85578.1 hypothetical protein ANOM_006651 [Aspergillus nomiae NRRL 13137]
MKSTFLFSLLPFLQGALGSTEVSGGSPATINDLPYVVSISKLGAYTCAGVIISGNRVVTSAQCVYGLEASPTSFSVRAGSSKTSSGGYVITVSKISRHPQFKPTTNDFDVAVLQLSSSITPGPTVKLAEFVQSGQEPADGAECVASGWGDLEGQLQSVTLPIVNREKCNETYAGQITDRMICGGSEAGKGTCPGDRGGPVTCGGKLAGIISQTNGCDLLGLPDVFTDVANSNIQAWIKSQ